MTKRRVPDGFGADEDLGGVMLHYGCPPIRPWEQQTEDLKKEALDALKKVLAHKPCGLGDACEVCSGRLSERYRRREPT